MNKKFPVLVSVTLALAPLSAVAQMHNQAGARANAGMPGVISGASLTNPGSMSMPLMPTTNLNPELTAPVPTVNAAMTPAAAAPAVTPATAKPVIVDSLYGEKEPVPPSSLPYLTGEVVTSPESVPFDGSKKTPVSDFSIPAKPVVSNEFSVDFQFTPGVDQNDRHTLVEAWAKQGWGPLEEFLSPVVGKEIEHIVLTVTASKAPALGTMATRDIKYKIGVSVPNGTQLVYFGHIFALLDMFTKKLVYSWSK